MMGTPAGQRLPAADNRVDVGRIELQPVAAPAGALGGDHGGAAAEKGVEHNVAAGRAVEDRVRDHCHRGGGRMQRQQIAFLAAPGEGIDPRIMPDISSVATKPAELDIVAMPVATVLIDKDELVLAAVKRTHPAIGLDPDAEVFE